MKKLIVAGLAGLLSLVTLVGSASAHEHWRYGWGRPYVRVTPVVPPVVVTPPAYSYPSYDYGYGYVAPPVVRVYPRWHRWGWGWRRW